MPLVRAPMLDAAIMARIGDGTLIADASTGRIYSCIMPAGQGMSKSCPPRELFGAKNKHGYLCISFSHDRASYDALTHRVVWMSVNGIVPAGMMLDHINRIRTDNRLENLRAVTPAGNAANSCLADGVKLAAPQVSEIRSLAMSGLSHRKVAAMFLVSKSHISRIVSGEQRGERRASG